MHEWRTGMPAGTAAATHRLTMCLLFMACHSSWMLIARWCCELLQPWHVLLWCCCLGLATALIVAWLGQAI
jgi:hypothetical protein